MAGQKGRDVLLKIGDGGAPQAFVTVAGVRAKTITLNARMVDATTADSVDQWRELIAGAGAKSAALSGSGVFKDAASDADIRALFFAQAARDWQIVVPDFGIMQGPFIVESLEYGGDHDGEATFSMSLSSAGALSFTAI